MANLSWYRTSVMMRLSHGFGRQRCPAIFYESTIPAAATIEDQHYMHRNGVW